jgi:hypothetical protein
MKALKQLRICATAPRPPPTVHDRRCVLKVSAAQQDTKKRLYFSANIAFEGRSPIFG